MARKKPKPETEANGVAVMDAPETTSFSEEELAEIQGRAPNPAYIPAVEPETDSADASTLNGDDAAAGQPGALPSVESVAESAESDDEIGDDDHLVTELRSQLAPLTDALDEGREAIDWKKKLQAKGREVASLKAELTGAAELHKEAKKAWEAASNELTLLATREPEKLPLIDGAKARAAAIEKPSEPKADESWRGDPISILELSASLTEKLADQGFHTVGHLADWSSKGRPLTDIPGVGGKTGEKIEEALTAYWAKRNADGSPAAKPALTGVDFGHEAGFPRYQLLAATTNGPPRSLGVFGTFEEAVAEARRITDTQGIEVTVDGLGDVVKEDAKELTKADYEQLANTLFGTKDNVYILAESKFGVDWTDAHFDLLKEHGGIVRCIECGGWKTLDEMSDVPELCDACEYASEHR